MHSHDHGGAGLHCKNQRIHEEKIPREKEKKIVDQF